MGPTAVGLGQRCWGSQGDAGRGFCGMMTVGNASQPCAPVPGTSQSMVLWCHAVVPKLAQPSPFSGAHCLGWQHCQEPSLELPLLGALTKHLGSIKLLWSPLHIYQTLTTFVFLAAAGAASLETRRFTSLFPFPNSF